jgi:hypothetical protein
MISEKERHAKRLLQKKRHIERQVTIMKSAAGFEHSHKQPHRYHKKKAVNCGNPNCIMCGNPRKMTGHKTLQEIKFEAVEIYDTD